MSQEKLIIQNKAKHDPKSKYSHLCCQITKSKYFYGYTLFTLILQFLSIGSVLGVFFHWKAKYYDYLAITCSLMLFVWTFAVFVVFKRNQGFQTKLALSLSVFLVVLSLLALLFAITTLVLVFSFNIDFLSDALNVERAVILAVAVTVVAVMTLLLYFNVLYLVIIKAKDEPAKTENVDSSGSQDIED